MEAAGSHSDSEIILRGNHIPERILRSALLSGRIANAYLLRGPAGAPKEALAMWFAKGLLCDSGDGSASEGCGDCWSCRAVSNHAHPDLVEIEKDGNTIKIKASHDMLKEALARPYHSARKVFVVKNAEDMTVEASNALLKVLEEPPPYVTFILTATNLRAIPETIISRCQTVPFRKMPADALIEALVVNHGVSREEAGEVSLHADGNLERALKILSSDLPGEAVLDEIRRVSVVDLALKYAKSEPARRLDVLLGLEVELEKRLRAKITGTNGDLGTEGCFREMETLYGSLRSLKAAKERLKSNVNSFLTFSTLFMDLARMRQEGE